MMIMLIIQIKMLNHVKILCKLIIILEKIKLMKRFIESRVNGKGTLAKIKTKIYFNVYLN